ncbi:unnamed protein product [Prorocentrum cordatum]|uniref:Uncharacterized protein n=1 Tax=Prorocentrum cordatum TaxID=2364126 RepID=A0ABN9VTG4_9DINO|nr:unnamed protein product [Polarella glacialis]
MSADAVPMMSDIPSPPQEPMTAADAYDWDMLPDKLSNPSRYKILAQSEALLDVYSKPMVKHEEDGADADTGVGSTSAEHMSDGESMEDEVDIVSMQLLAGMPPVDHGDVEASGKAGGKAQSIYQNMVAAGVPPAPEDSKEDDDDDALIRQFKDALHGGEIMARSAMGQKFATAMKNDEKLERDYGKCKGRDRQRNFKKKWVKDTLNKLIEEKITEKEEDSITRGKRGKYKPFSIIVSDEGNDELAYKAALNVVKNCFKLMQAGKTFVGEPFSKTDMQSERVKFLHLDEYVDSNFKRTKGTEKIFKKSDTETAGSAAEPTTETPKTKQGQETRTPPKGKEPTTNPTKRQRGAQPDAGQPRKAAKFSFTKALKAYADASKAQQSCKDVTHAVSTKADWQKAVGDGMVQDLREARKAVETFLESSPYWANVGLADNFQKWAKTNLEATDIVDETNRSGELDSLVAKLVEATNRCKRVYEASIAA